MQADTPLLIPGLPNDLADLCLARLPKGLHAIAQSVSRSWRNALLLPSSSVNALRDRLDIVEEWVVFCILGNFYLIDPILALCQPLPGPPPFQNDCLLNRLHIMAVNRGEMVAAFPGLQHSTLLLDVIRRRWSKRLPGAERTCCAWAVVGGYSYMASDFLAYGLPFRGADRLDLHSGRTDRLPDMHKHRYSAAGVVVNGSFCVLSGYSDDDSPNLQSLSSGEIWNSETASWVLVPNMWPAEMGRSCPPMVTNVKEKLYGLKQGTDQIFSYDEKHNLWTQLGSIPSVVVHVLLGVRDELWAVCVISEGISIFATTLTVGQPLVWRKLPYRIPHPNACVTPHTVAVITV